MLLMLGMQEYLSFSVCLLKILCRGCSFGKHLFMMFMNFLPRLVFPLAFHGRSCTKWLFFCDFCCALAVGCMWACGCSRSRHGAFWYGGIASLKTFLLDEMLVSRLLMFSGLFFSSAGDCFLGVRRGFCCWVSWRVYTRGGMCRPGLQIGTPFWKNFPSNWYPVLEMGRFFIPHSRICRRVRMSRLHHMSPLSRQISCWCSFFPMGRRHIHDVVTYYIEIQRPSRPLPWRRIGGMQSNA